MFNNVDRITERLKDIESKVKKNSLKTSKFVSLPSIVREPIKKVPKL